MFAKKIVVLVLGTVVCTAGLGVSNADGQTLTPEQRQSIEAAVPARAPAKPKQPRRLLVVSLQMRNGAPVQGPSYAALAAQNYALEQTGKRTGARDVVERVLVTLAGHEAAHEPFNDAGIGTVRRAELNHITHAERERTGRHLRVCTR